MKKTKNMKKNQLNKKVLYGSLVALAIVIVVTLTITTGNKDTKELTVTENITDTSTGNAVSGLFINKSEITKTASFFPYESDGTYMEIIAVRANDDTIRTALNTCQVCYSSGRGYYEQLGDKLICNNCGNQFTIDQIELVKGGCNPVPILDEMKTDDGDIITIDPASLVEFEPLFANWKR